MSIFDPVRYSECFSGWVKASDGTWSCGLLIPIGRVKEHVTWLFCLSRGGLGTEDVTSQSVCVRAYTRAAGEQPRLPAQDCRRVEG